MGWLGGLGGVGGVWGVGEGGGGGGGGGWFGNPFFDEGLGFKPKTKPLLLTFVSHQLFLNY